MYWALPFAFVSLLLMAYTMKESNYGHDEDPDDGSKQEYRHIERAYFIVCICVYVLAVAIGLSTTVWGISSEIIPNYLLATGSALVQAFGWIINFIINSFFLDALDDPQGRWIVFLVLAIMVALALLFIIFLVPETIGKSAKENLKNLMGEDFVRDQRKKLRKEYQILDVEVTIPQIKDNMEQKK